MGTAKALTMIIHGDIPPPSRPNNPFQRRPRSTVLIVSAMPFAAPLNGSVGLLRALIDRLFMDMKTDNLNIVMPRFASDKGVASNDGNTIVYFKNLEQHLIKHIKAAQIVVGCVAWLTHPAILQALAGIKKGVSIIVQKEDFLRPDLNSTSQWRSALRKRYEKLKSVSVWPGSLSMLTQALIEDYFIDPVRCVGIYNRVKALAAPRMHHKFLVFCRLKTDEKSTGGTPLEKIEPYAVWTGSFNLTINASNSLENAVVIADAAIAQAYFDEWEGIVFSSEPLDWEKEWIHPDYTFT